MARLKRFIRVEGRNAGCYYAASTISKVIGYQCDQKKIAKCL